MSFFSKKTIGFFAKKDFMGKGITKIKNKVSKQLESSEAINTEVFVAHLVNNVPLSEKQEEMFNRFNYVFTLFRAGYGNELVVKAVANGNTSLGFDKCSLSEARKIVNMTKEIFGDAYETNLKFRKWASIEFYDSVAKEAKELKAFPDAIRAREKADTIAGVFDKQNDLDPNDFMDPKGWNIIITADPKALLIAEGVQEDQETSAEEWGGDDYE
jgi:hypothetical protein